MNSNLTQAEPAMGAIEDLFLDLEAALGVHLTVLEVGAVFYGPEGEPLLGKMRKSHQRLSVCAAQHGPRCLQHCRREVNVRAARLQRPFVTRCWQGLMEVVVPLTRDGIHLATVFAGMWRSPRLPKGAQDWPAAAREARAALPVFDAEQAARLQRVMGVVGQGIMAALDAAQGLRGPRRTRRAQVLHFLRNHAGRRVALADLAQHLHLSPSRASHVVQEIFHASFQDLLKTERIRRVKALLLSTDLRQSEIAERVGMSNAYYFSRFFRQAVGVPPGEFRRNPPTPASMRP